MKRFGILACGVTLALSGLSIACRREAPPQEQVPPTEEAAAAPALDTLAMFVRPQDELMNAFNDFMNKNLSSSAASLRQAAAFVRSEAASATAEAKDALDRAAAKLDQLSTQVESGQLRSANEIDDAAAHVHYVLARHHQIQAAAAWSSQDLTKAGIELQAATSHLGRTLEVLSKGTEAEVSVALQGARNLGDSLARGATAIPEQVESTMAALVLAIDQVRRQVDPSGR